MIKCCGGGICTEDDWWTAEAKSATAVCASPLHRPDHLFAQALDSSSRRRPQPDHVQQAQQQYDLASRVSTRPGESKSGCGWQSRRALIEQELLGIDDGASLGSAKGTESRLRQKRYESERRRAPELEGWWYALLTWELSSKPPSARIASWFLQEILQLGTSSSRHAQEIQPLSSIVRHIKYTAAERTIATPQSYRLSLM
ncbi:hypothetical protein DFH27DRAFT_606795 [Peziza echinospora]|nr:hypothetical protein DFH27DRAFT_606795 [Peziza echinospora]